jgi:hypothetical protein
MRHAVRHGGPKGHLPIVISQWHDANDNWPPTHDESLIVKEPSSSATTLKAENVAQPCNVLHQIWVLPHSR